LRIAIIDSGVHAQHPHVQGVAGGVGVDDDGREHDDYVDRMGHGTAVTAVIREKAPQAEIFAVKVFDRQLTATGTALIAALKWARQAGVQIINLSLGTTNVDHESTLAAQVRAAHTEGIVIVAAAPEGGRRWLPGALPGVVRVTLDPTLSRDECRAAVDEGEITIAASGYPRPIPGVPPENNLKGLSFAVANATGILAQHWPDWRSALLPRPDRSL
jgi:subtilisin family serine protease